MAARPQVVVRGVEASRAEIGRVETGPAVIDRVAIGLGEDPAARAAGPVAGPKAGVRKGASPFASQHAGKGPVVREPDASLVGHGFQSMQYMWTEGMATRNPAFSYALRAAAWLGSPPVPTSTAFAPSSFRRRSAKTYMAVPIPLSA